MRDHSFFQGVEQQFVEEGGFSFCQPTFYYDVMTLNTVFLTPLKRVQARLPSARMHPVRATPWHALTAITTFEYRGSDIGPYNEVAISFPITIDKKSPVFFGMLRQLSEGPVAYVLHLPVTTEIARYGGVRFYNFPKFLADIQFKQEGGWTHCRLAEDEREILHLSVRQLPVKAAAHGLMHGITVRDGRILRSEVILNLRRQGVSRNPADVRLELGDHPIAQELRSLRLGRLLHCEYLPANQAILTGVIESHPMA